MEQITYILADERQKYKVGGETLVVVSEGELNGCRLVTIPASSSWWNQRWLDSLCSAPLFGSLLYSSRKGAESQAGVVILCKAGKDDSGPTVTSSKLTISLCARCTDMHTHCQIHTLIKISLLSNISLTTSSDGNFICVLFAAILTDSTRNTIYLLFLHSSFGDSSDVYFVTGVKMEMSAVMPNTPPWDAV